MNPRIEILKRFAQDILYFGRTIRPSAFEIESPDFHRKIAAYLRRAARFPRLNIIAPRGFAKTTLVGFFYVLWHIFVEDFANGRKRQPKFVVIVSKSRPHSINILSSIKQTLNTSDALRSIFGDFSENTAITWREDKVMLKDGTIIDCRGMQQQVRGMNINNRRPTLIVLDDAEDEENTKTEHAIAENRKWFLNALTPMVKRTDPKGRIVNIGTPQNQLCIVFTLKDMPNWKSLHFSAIEEDEDGNEKSLWPEMMTLEELYAERDALASIGRVSAFYREYLCQIVGDEDALVIPDDLRFWDGHFVKEDRNKRAKLIITHRGRFSEPDKLDQPEELEIFTYMGVDPASTLSARADYSCIFIVGIDQHRNVYCIAYFRKRVKPMKLANAIIQNFETYNPERTRIESTGYQEMIRDYLRNEYENYIPGIEIKHAPRNQKSRRLESLQPLFAQNKVFIKRGMEEFTEEVLLYPRARHDDTLDGFYYAQLNSYPPTEAPSSTEQDLMERELKHFGFINLEREPEHDWLLS